MNWDEALDALEQYARDERHGLANDARTRSFVPPPGPVPARLRARAESVLAELHATEEFLAGELARVGAELTWINNPAGTGARIDRSA